MKKLFTKITTLLITLTLSISLMATDQVVTSNANSGAGTLRQAIIDAGDGDDITFNLSSGNETITILTELAINENLTIIGLNTAGSGVPVTVTVTTPGASTYRVFNLSGSDKTVNISNMTIKGGYIAQGGSIYSDIATFNLENLTVSDSKASSSSSGGGIYQNQGNMTLNNVTISNCTVTSSIGVGGGIVVRNGAVATITNSTFSGNVSAKYAGAISVYGDGSSITNCTFSGNTATTHDGGAIFFSKYNGNLTITDCTIANNTAGGNGGGIINYQGTITIKNTIIANNTGGDYYFNNSANSSLTDNGYNVVEYSNVAANVTGGFDNATSILYNTKADGTTGYSTWNRNNADLLNQNLNLSSTLAENNTINETQNLALSSGSFAIDAGTGTDDDQRSTPIYNSTKDIGAFEYNPNWTVWTGGSSTAWGTPGNWSSSPNASSDIGIVPNSTFNPLVNSAITCNSLNVTDNSSLTIDYNGSFTITDDLINNGTFTINSTAGGTGSLIVDGTATGDVTAQRYVDEASKGATWHYVSSPVMGQNIDDTWMSSNSIAQNSGQYMFYRFDEDTDYWIYYNYTGSEPEAFGDATFVEARGYAATRTVAGTYSFTGTVRTSDVTYAASYTSDKGVGFNLVGNPFTSSIGVTSSSASTENFLAENTTLLDNSYEALYIWDEQTTYVGSRNDYKVISNGAIANYTKLSNNYIQPGQAFMVKVVSGGGSLAFNENMQYHSTDAFYKEEKDPWPSVELIVKNNELFNSTAIGFNDNMTIGLDPSYDVGKLKGNPNIALYTKLIEDNGVDFAIQALPTNNTENYVVSVGVDVLETQELEFLANTVELDNYNIVLEDRSLDIFTDLDKNTYTATVSNSGTGRFFLHFRDINGIDDDNFKLNTLRTYASGNSLYIVNPEMKRGTVTIYNLTGQKVAVFELTGDTKQQQILNMNDIINIVQIRTNDEVVSGKVILR